MSENEKKIAVWQQAIASSKLKFNDINKVSNFVNYDTEAMFAMQIINKNSYLMGIANSNPASLRDAVINIASIGLSLNPATKYAYLVPREKAACLDISYIGLIKLATDTGSILWARAEMVHETDIFKYNGPVDKPDFSSPHPFNRGAIVGVFCISKTAHGDYLSGIMSLQDINDIKNRSPSASKGYGPWITDFSEMAKKTIIKRESKTWPKTVNTARLDKAIEIVNNHEGIDFEAEKNFIINDVELITESQAMDISTMISDGGIDIGIFNKFLKSKNIDGVENIPVSIHNKIINKIKSSIEAKAKQNENT